MNQDDQIVSFFQWCETHRAKATTESLLTEHQLNFLELRPLPSTLYELPSMKNFGIVTEFIRTRTDESFGGNTNDDGSTQIYGCSTLPDKTKIYFMIMDDPGWSGYDCCGRIALNYTLDLEDLVHNGLTSVQKYEILKTITSIQ